MTFESGEIVKSWLNCVQEVPHNYLRTQVLLQEVDHFARTMALVWGPQTDHLLTFGLYPRYRQLDMLRLPLMCFCDTNWMIPSFRLPPRAKDPGSVRLVFPIAFPENCFVDGEQQPLSWRVGQHNQIATISCPSPKRHGIGNLSRVSMSGEFRLGHRACLLEMTVAFVHSVLLFSFPLPESTYRRCI